MTEVRRYTYAQAAEATGIPESHLRRHIKQLPHKKRGRTVWFTDEDLQRIDQLSQREPTTGPLAAAVAAPDAAPAVASVHPMAHLRPLPGRNALKRA